MIAVESRLSKAESLLIFLGMWEEFNLKTKHLTSNEAKLNCAHALLKEKFPECDPSCIEKHQIRH
jgi:hypothetical protein